MAYLPRLLRTTLWTALLSLLTLAQAFAADITAVRSWRAPDNTRLVFDLSGPVKFQVSSDSTPARLVVEIEGARPAGPLALPAAQAPLRALRLEPTARGQRLVIETAVELMPKVFQLAPNEKYGHRLVLDLYEKNSPRPAPGERPGGAIAIAIAVPAPATVAAPERDAVARPSPAEAAPPAERKPATDKAANVAPAGPAPETAAPGATTASAPPVATAPPMAPVIADKAEKTARPAAPGRGGEREVAGPRPAEPEAAATEKYDIRRHRNIIVAIDAGHGGEDPGAIGQNGTHEKNVTLAIARELQARLEAEPGITAVLTRTGDYFLPLQERRRVARYQHKADIFVSIHADSALNTSARGASVFALSLKGAGNATSRFARMLAERENRADLIGGAAIENEDNVLRNVLADMVVAGSLDHSLHMGRNILGGLGRIGRLHSRNVEQAGFAVLKEPGMVSLLVETGFISNPEEEKKLISRQHQQDIAAAVAAGIRRYCQQYPAPATYFAWLAERGRNVAAAGRRPREGTAAANAGQPTPALAPASDTVADAVPAEAAAPVAAVRVAASRAQPAEPPADKAADAAGRDGGQRARRPATAETSRFVTHRVAPGESLTRLSDRYGVSLARLRESNELRDDNIRIGQTLKIPRN